MLQAADEPGSEARTAGPALAGLIGSSHLRGPNEAASSAAASVLHFSSSILLHPVTSGESAGVPLSVQGSRREPALFFHLTCHLHCLLACACSAALRSISRKLILSALGLWSTLVFWLPPPPASWRTFTQGASCLLAPRRPCLPPMATIKQTAPSIIVAFFIIISALSS